MDSSLSNYRTPTHVLPLLALASLLATSVWFAVNAVLPSLTQMLGQEQDTCGYHDCRAIRIYRWHLCVCSTRYR